MLFRISSIIFIILLVILLWARGAINLPIGVILATVYCCTVYLVSPSAELSAAKRTMKTVITVILCVGIGLAVIHIVGTIGNAVNAYNFYPPVGIPYLPDIHGVHLNKWHYFMDKFWQLLPLIVVIVVTSKCYTQLQISNKQLQEMNQTLTGDKSASL